MEFFEGFKWAIPLSFSEPLKFSRFEEGDVLYDNPKAYHGNWKTGLKHIKHYIQVAHPPRSVATQQQEAEAVFDSNWRSEVILDLFDVFADSKTRITTTQGRLYSALWKGDLGHLSLDSEEPEIPLRVRAATKEMSNNEDNISNAVESFPCFAMAVDLSNSVSSKKYHTVLSALKSHLDYAPRIISLQQSKFPAWTEFAPTVSVALFEAPALSGRQLLEKIKSAVYRPSPKTKRSMFRLKAHGLILEAPYSGGPTVGKLF